MNTLFTITEDYLEYCKTQRRLDWKTLKAYRTDLNQFVSFFNISHIHAISIPDIEKYIGYLHQTFKPKTAKRKLASIKAFYHFLEYNYMICFVILSYLLYRFQTMPDAAYKIFLSVFLFLLSAALLLADM